MTCASDNLLMLWLYLFFLPPADVEGSGKPQLSILPKNKQNMGLDLTNHTTIGGPAK